MQHAKKPTFKKHPMSKAQVVTYAAKRRKRHQKRVRVTTIATVSAIVVLVGAVAAGAWWFFSNLDEVLGRNTDQQASDVLVEAVDDEPFYMLVLASDARDTEHDGSVGQQTDVMILTRVDAKSHQVTMLSIPRDTRYVLADGSVVKMNSLYSIGGVKLAIEGVSALTGVPISHYAMVYMSDCKNVVDTLGGVEVDVKVEVNNLDPETGENVNLQPGVQTLDGRQAQAFAISRYEFTTDKDQQRQAKIRMLVEAIIEKTLDRPAAEIPGLVIELAQYVETDLRSSDLTALAADFAAGSGKVVVYQGSGPSDGDIDEATGLWLCYEDPEGWAEVMSVVDSGGDPSSVTYGD